ncbi:MAG: hypothetical protein LV481_03145 [Methylacidiphilales bacterium]|nr:hypothetical protein [Candidatus Methylacidiphilales bacterium]
MRKLQSFTRETSHVGSSNFDFGLVVTNAAFVGDGFPLLISKHAIIAAGKRNLDPTMAGREYVAFSLPYIHHALSFIHKRARKEITMPPSINDYETDLDRARRDAAANPLFRDFLESGDFEMMVVDGGDGTQMQVQALAGRSVQRVLEKVSAWAREKGVDMKEAICSPNGFNLCSKLNMPVGQRMRELDAFLKSMWTEGALAIAGVAAIAANPAFGWFLAIFGALGFINKAFVGLCNCPKRT